MKISAVEIPVRQGQHLQEYTLHMGLGSGSQQTSSGLCVYICYSGNYAKFW